jgi:hypothetical protein
MGNPSAIAPGERIDKQHNNKKGWRAGPRAAWK